MNLKEIAVKCETIEQSKIDELNKQLEELTNGR